MVSSVDIRSDHLRIVQDILCTHLPSGVKVWVFGSRATWATKDSSDLDLAVESDTPLDFRTINILQDAFEDSSLPYTVDVVDINQISDSFRQIVEAHKTPLPIPKNILKTRASAHSQLSQNSKQFGARHTKSIDDVCLRVTSGGTPSRSNSSFYTDGLLPWLKTQELKDEWLDDADEHITEAALASSSAKILPKNTVLMAMYGATVGQLGILRCPMTCNQACCAMIVDPEQADHRYLFYSLLHARPLIKNLSTGAAQQNLNTQLIKSLKFSFPSLPEQCAISHILGTLDDKIELNQKMNQTLEEIAKAIFKSWFVDFEPVRAKVESCSTGLPPEINDLFPDELVDSEIGEIPKGWKVEEVSILATLFKKSISPTKSNDTFAHYSIPAFDAGQCPLLDVGSTIKSNKTLIPDDALLVSKLNPEIPRVWIPSLDSSFKKICSTEFMVFQPTPKSNRSFLWTMFSEKKIQARMESMVTGTSKSHQRVKPKDVSKILIPCPTDRLIEVFGEIAEPLLSRILVSREKSLLLNELRDTLLPKLISGELRIPDTEKFLEKVGI